MPKEKSDKLQNIYIYILVLKAERFGWKTKNKKEVKHRKQLGERKMNFLRRVISPGSRSQVSQFANRSFKITQKHYGSIAQPTSSSLVHGIHQFHCPVSQFFVHLNESLRSSYEFLISFKENEMRLQFFYE